MISITDYPTNNYVYHPMAAVEWKLIIEYNLSSRVLVFIRSLWPEFQEIGLKATAKEEFSYYGWLSFQISWFPNLVDGDRN
jgi:hypothetical protein